MLARPVPALALVLGLIAPVSARSQDLQEDAQGGSLASRIGGWFERQPLDAQQRLAGAGVFPIASSFAQGTGPAPGLTLFRPRLAGGPLDLMVAGARSFHGDSFQEIRVGRLPHEPLRAPARRDTLESLAPAFASGAPERTFFYAELRHREFAGGMVFDDQGGTTPYRLDESSIDLVAGRRLGQRWTVALRAGALSAAPSVSDSGGTMATLLDAGVQPRERFYRGAASLAFDNRDHPRRTTRGTFLELSLARFESRDAQASFNRLTLDARRFQPLGSESRVLALRATATRDGGGSGLEVPFYLLDSLGGDRLRGYDPYRFRGPSVASFTAEYRQSLGRPVQAVAFWDAGRAWGGAPAMGTDGLRSSFGLGLRLLSSDRVLLRLEGARGAEGSRFHCGLGFAF